MKKMKLNFMKVLSAKVGPDEIAEQIALLEQKQKEIQAERDSLRGKAKELRQRRICQEPVSDTQIREADNKVESAGLDLEAIAETIARLTEKLLISLEEHKEIAEKERLKENGVLSEEYKIAQEELARAKARLLVFAETVIGPVAHQYLKSGSLYNFDSDTNHIFEAEVEKVRSQVRRPTYYERRQAYETKGDALLRFSLDDEYEKIIDKYRAKYQAGKLEKDPASV